MSSDIKTKIDKIAEAEAEAQKIIDHAKQEIAKELAVVREESRHKLENHEEYVAPKIREIEGQMRMKYDFLEKTAKEEIDAKLKQLEQVNKQLDSVADTLVAKLIKSLKK